MPSLLKEIAKENLAGILDCLKEGAKINDLKHGNTPLMAAIAQGASDQVLELLLENGANVNVSNKAGETPLMLASRQGYTPIVSFLLRNGAEVNAQDKGGSTALMMAVLNDQFSVEILIKAGAFLNQSNKAALTALDYAYNSQRYTSAVLLVQAGAKIEETYFSGKRNAKLATQWVLHTAPAFYAIDTANHSLLEEQLKFGVSPDTRIADDSHEPLLIKASELGNKNIVQLLTEHGADVNITSASGGWSALTKASSFGRSDVVAVLLEYGANVNYKTSSGYDSLSYAAMSGYLEVIKEILQYAKKKNIAISKEQALTWAIKNNFASVVNMLKA